MATQDWPSETWADFSVGSSGTTTTMTGTAAVQYGTLTYSGNLVISGYTVNITRVVQTESTDTLTIENGGSISGYTINASNIILDGGQILYSGGAVSQHTTITLKHDNNQGNTIYLPDGDFSGKLTITGLSPADTISVASGTISNISDVTSGTVALTLGDGTVMDIDTAINPSTGEYFTASDFTYSDNSLTCFLSGSMIQTSNGSIAVEDLTIGSEIVSLNKDIYILRCVTWVGHAHCKVRPYLPLDQAGYPVRILKDAVSDGVPFKDMLITAEHCLFFDGKFVPARMLVNGRSIFYDTSITSYDYYHIETAEHSVIIADGMLTESYLDTGNRNVFRQSGEVVSLTPSRNLSWDDAAAPLTVSRETVEPLFRNIENRADKAGHTVQTEARPLTNDSDLHLTTNTGAVIRPARQHDGRVMFMIPSGVESVRIVSNASRPCDVIGPFIDDRRSLGVLVGTVTLFESNRTRTLTDHLHDVQLSGWNNVEEGTMRWTRGNALLPLGERAPGTLAQMVMEVRAAGPYVLDETISEYQALKA